MLLLLGRSVCIELEFSLFIVTRSYVLFFWVFWCAHADKFHQSIWLSRLSMNESIMGCYWFWWMWMLNANAMFVCSIDLIWACDSGGLLKWNHQASLFQVDKCGQSIRHCWYEQKPRAVLHSFPIPHSSWCVHTLYVRMSPQSKRSLQSKDCQSAKISHFKWPICHLNHTHTTNNTILFYRPNALFSRATSFPPSDSSKLPFIIFKWIATFLNELLSRIHTNSKTMREQKKIGDQ